MFLTCIKDKFQFVHFTLFNLVRPWWYSDLSLGINLRATLLIRLIFGLVKARASEIQHIDIPPPIQ